MKDLLEAGVHFGHQTKRWNPKMKAVHLRRAERHLHHRPRARPRSCSATPRSSSTNLAADGRTVLFVGTKRQAQDVDRRRSAALRHVLRQPALARRPADQLHDDPAQPRPAARPRGDGDRRPLRDAVEEGNRAASRRRSASCRRTSKASATCPGCPTRVFVVDTRKEKIAVDEARKLKIPVIGIVDTNCDPDEVDFVIPGNDDALRAIRLFASRIADAVHLRPRHPRVGAGRRRRRTRRRRPNPARARPAPGRVREQATTPASV